MNTGLESPVNPRAGKPTLHPDMESTHDFSVELLEFLPTKIISQFCGLDSLCPTGFARMLSQERQHMTTNEQLELGFNGTQTRILGRRRETRMARGQWW